jgi:hypothetical protein
MNASEIQSGSARLVDPMYYRDELIDGWVHDSNGWRPASSRETMRGGWSTDDNMFQLQTKNYPYRAELRVGPDTQHVRVWKDAYSWRDATERELVRAPCLPYVVFAAAMKAPEQFL